jgi:hypothetical protein
MKCHFNAISCVGKHVAREIGNYGTPYLGRAAVYKCVLYLGQLCTIFYSVMYTHVHYLSKGKLNSFGYPKEAAWNYVFIRNLQNDSQVIGFARFAIFYSLNNI